MKASNDQLFEFDFEANQLRLTLSTLFVDQPWVVARYEQFMESLREQIVQDDG